jgi:hypothetical protein
MATLENLEIRLAAIAATQSDLIAAVHSVEATQHVLGDALREYRNAVTDVETMAMNTGKKITAIQESLGELKALIAKALEQ